MIIINKERGKVVRGGFFLNVQNMSLISWRLFKKVSYLMCYCLTSVLGAQQQVNIATETHEVNEHNQLIAPSAVSTDLVIPDIAWGYEKEYREFYNARLVYKPNRNNNYGRIEIPFSSLSNVLEGTFDLQDCGDASQHISISTGFRRKKNPDNKNKHEIWVLPRFVAARDPGAEEIWKMVDHWWPENIPVGLFVTAGNWDSKRVDFDYTTTLDLSYVSRTSLWKIHASARSHTIFTHEGPMELWEGTRRFSCLFDI